MRVVALLPLALVACTGAGEPSVDNIRDALAQAGNRGAAKAEKLACTRSPDRPGYNCDYRAPACNRFSGACGADRPFTGRFLHAGGRWQLVEDLSRQAAPDPVTQPLTGIAPAATPSAATLPVAPPPAAAPPVVPEPPMPPEPARAPPAAIPDAPAARDPLSPRDARLVSRWLAEDARCRAGAGLDRAGEAACEDRTTTAERLRDRGLCYVRPDGWRRCD